MNDFVNLLAVFVSSVITSMGLGGGSFYILYLTFLLTLSNLLLKVIIYCFFFHALLYL